MSCSPSTTTTTTSSADSSRTIGLASIEARRVPKPLAARNVWAVSDRLDAYRSKRDFGATPEPGPGEADAAAEENRFVVHEHHARRLHWDLRLERDGVLASWAVPKGIPMDPDENHLAVHTEDPPLEYIDFHGQIPEGNYGAGKMVIFDEGTYECHKWKPDRGVMTPSQGGGVGGKYVFSPPREKDGMTPRMDPPVDPERDPFPE